MRYPHHFHEHEARHHGDRHAGDRRQRDRHHGDCHHGDTHHGDGHRSGRPDRFHRGHRGRGRSGVQQPRGDARRLPTLERSIVKSARRIRRSGLTPEQLHRRIASAVSHEDYRITMRTLRRVGMELRAAAGTER